MNYLPIIVLVVIILIGIVSSDLLKDNAGIFATLVIVFAFVTFIHYLSPSKIATIENEDPAPTLLPKLANGLDFSGTKNIILRIVVPIILFVLGLGLGFGSIDASRSAEKYDPSVGLMTIGGILISFGVIAMLFHIVITKKPVTEWIHYVILSIIIGIPLVVRGNEIKSDLGSSKLTEDENKSEYQKAIANTSAEWMLGIGVFFQIAVFMAVGYYLWNYTSSNSFTTPSWNKWAVLAGIALAIFMPGGLFLSKSLGLTGSGFGTDDDEKLIDKEPFEYKAFMVHAVIYLIVGVVFLFILFGQTEKITVLRIGLFLLPLTLFFACIVVVSVQQAKNDEEMKISTLKDDKDSVYYNKQLRDEAVKELKQKNSNATQANIDKAVEDRVDKLKRESQGPTTAIMWLFSFISLIIVAFIMRSWMGRKYLFSIGSTIKGADADIKEKMKDDKMLSDDWDKLLTIPDNDPKSLTIRFAKWFSFTPFLSVILLILWVSILFTNVNTSPTTTNWIGKNFSGDMFPRVKELIDTFFIVIIAGLSLCAILLLPIVKEMNVGGLESILKFAESVQVWQYNEVKNSDWTNWRKAIFGFLLVFGAGLSWWWHYLLNKSKEEDKTGTSLPIVPDNWGWAIAFVVLLAFCSMPTWFNFLGSARVHNDFAKEIGLKRILRQILTTVYLVPLLFAVVFRAGVYGIASLTGLQEFITKRNQALDTLKFWKWDAEKTDLRMFPTTVNGPTPASVTSVRGELPGGVEVFDIPVPEDAKLPTKPPTGINETKVSAIGKLIKVILLTISFVILILAVIYYVYKIDAEFTNKNRDADGTASGGIAAQLNSPTAHTIYVIMAIVAVAGLVAYIRDKFTKTNAKTPENYLFNDMKTEDEANPLRQLAFGATHIVYVILMVIVWIYDRDKDDKDRMSVTGMTILGLAILFFHYGLEFIDTMTPKKPDGSGEKPSVADLFANIRFIINTVFFIILCSLAYYKQHGVMVVLILAMFIFHLTKSAIGIKLLHLLWLGIIYIPCLFLDLLQSSQSAAGDTTRPIWIIVAIELLLIAILFGGPYLLNYIGASASQIVAAPVTLKNKYDTNLTTQSPKIFIFHNTGIDRTDDDKAAKCPVEEKKRYNYSISGWFILNNNATSTNNDLEIFNFGDVPKLTYNPSTTELKLFCNIIDISTGLPKPNPELIYSSKTNYNNIISGKSKEKQQRIKMLLDNDDELDAPIPFQRWNYFVVNYNGKTMDLFLNTKLISRSDFIMPDIQLKSITVGDGTVDIKTPTNTFKGLNGSICNFAFHNTPLTKDQMRWTYNMLKSQNPPIIGMKTIEDEVKATGSTTVYSK